MQRLKSSTTNYNVRLRRRNMRFKYAAPSEVAKDPALFGLLITKARGVAYKIVRAPELDSTVQHPQRCPRISQGGLTCALHPNHKGKHIWSIQ